MKKGVRENFAKFTGKHLCQSLFVNKVAGLKPPKFLKAPEREYSFSKYSRNLNIPGIS